MSLTKEHLIQSLCTSSSFSKGHATQVLETLLETIKLALERGEDVLISGFGKFSVKEKDPRRGRNPQTGHDLTLGARRVVTFKCSSSLRAKINGSV